MTVCTTEPIVFTRCKRRKVVADFGGGEITSDAGVLLLSEADKRLRLTQRIAPQFNDPRCKGKCDHSLQDMLRQRIYALALGYEDLNDHQTLRKDTALQTAVGRDTDLASNATLCRFENRATRQMCWQISRELVEGVRGRSQYLNFINFQSFDIEYLSHANPELLFPVPCTIGNRTPQNLQ